jgi:hypothetical protein
VLLLLPQLPRLWVLKPARPRRYAAEQHAF